MSAQKIAILGGTGFIGQYLACELARRQYPVRVLTRRRERKRDLLVIPALELREVDPYSASALSNALKGCTVVINLVGILNQHSRHGQSFKDAHQQLPEIIADAARFNRISRILHMSALNATADAPSEYLRSKAAGESRLHTLAGDDLKVTSFRPSVVFGPGDGFFNLFARLLSLSPLVFPLACADTRFAPVYVGDVARAFAASLNDQATHGQGYNLCGPRRYTLAELVRYTASLIGVKPWIVPLGDGLAKLQAAILEKLPGQLFSMDNYLSMQVDSVCDDSALPDLGITPECLENIVPGYIGRGGQEQFLDSLRIHARRD